VSDRRSLIPDAGGSGESAISARDFVRVDPVETPGGRDAMVQHLRSIERVSQKRRRDSFAFYARHA